MQFFTFVTFTQKIFKELNWNALRSFDKVINTRSMMMVSLASIMRHNWCIFFHFFFYFSQKVFNHSGWNFTWAFGMTICCWRCKMFSFACIIKYKMHDLCFFKFFFTQSSFLTKHYVLNYFPPPNFLCR